MTRLEDWFTDYSPNTVLSKAQIGELLDILLGADIEQ